MTLNTSDLIEECMLLLSAPVEFTDCELDIIDNAADPAAMADQLRRAHIENRITNYCEGRDDRLRVLRYVRLEAQRRLAHVNDEVNRLTKACRRESSLIEFIDNTTEQLLRAERLSSGADPLASYRVDCGPGSWVKLAVRHSQRVEVIDVELLPVEYLKTVITPRKDDLGKALKAGAEIPGAVIETRTTERIQWAK